MYAVVDIETTGKGYHRQKITEISIIIFDGKQIVNEFTSLVNPQQQISTFITNLTGITNAMIRNAPLFATIANKVAEITKGCIFVAHNVNFDYNIIKDEFKNIGLDFKRKKLCTVRLSRKIMPNLRSYSLGSICALEQIPINGRHRAKGDAEATVELFKRLIQRDKTFVINSFLNAKSKQATLPPLLDKKIVDELPEKAGVYYFKNNQKKIIYVGKANNIKQRVISHFYDKKKKEREMCIETADISYTETGSELLALLLESSEIKHRFPKYNTVQKNNREATSLFTYEDQKGIIHIAFNRSKLVNNELIQFAYLSECRNFISKLCTEFDLCPKYCHLLENTKNCELHFLKTCKGICNEKETISIYNVKVRNAIKSITKQFESRVIIEKGRQENEIGFVLILNGKYKGFGYVDNTIADQLKTPEEYQFYLEPKKENKDIQKILAGYFRKTAHKKRDINGKI